MFPGLALFAGSADIAAAFYRRKLFDFLDAHKDTFLPIGAVSGSVGGRLGE